VLVGIGLALVRASGAHAGMARRLAGAPQLRVGELADLPRQPGRPVRLVGRIRCPDPIVTAQDDRLVALHRDVEVRAGGRWRTIERMRETRGFELWDHDGSQPIDPADAAEPLVGIPHVWRGSPDELRDPGHLAALARLRAEHGDVGEARAVTRMVSVVERLLVLASVSRGPDGGMRVVPPPGGYVISTLELDDAMRLLAGRRRRWLLAGVAIGAVGALLTSGAAAAALVVAVAG
jgi:hypothetical protein